LSDFFETGDPGFLQWVETLWKIEFKGVRREFDIQGSPERTLSRAVMEDGGGRLFLVEKYSLEKLAARIQISKTIAHLNSRGLVQALACHPTSGGEFLPVFRSACFQISPFLDSTGVDRPGWLASGDMGGNMAAFLIQMAQASQDLPAEICFSPFSIKAYILKLFDQMRVHDGNMYDRYAPFKEFLERDFMDAHDQLPQKFCHGDFHPLNVLWDQTRIRAVIDWEFTGLKPEVYDAANLLGCAGIEDPQGLAMPMATTFLRKIRASGIVSPIGWHYFPEYILALRFAWLSEWLRKKDGQMLDLEAVYMDILVRHMDELRSLWEIG